MSKKREKPAVSAKQKKNGSADNSAEIGDIIELISAQLISFVIPPSFDKAIKTLDDVSAHAYRITLLHQFSEDGFFRYRIDVDITVHFGDEESIETSAQSVTTFKSLIPLEEGEPFAMSLLPDGAIYEAASIAYSTTRGLILAKGSGTILQDAVLPVASISELLANQSNN